MEEEFADIRIVDLDVEMTRPSEKASGLRHMHLKLTDEPTQEWIELFEQERQFARHGMWREAWIENSHIVVDCIPDEIEKYHLRDLKEDVSNANRKYREWIARRDAAASQELKQSQEEKKKLDELRNKLNFE